MVDCVCASQVLAFTWHQPAALAQLAALLRAGGRFVCVESFDTGEEVDAFVSGCVAHGLALRVLEMVKFADHGADGAYPGLVFEKPVSRP
jgi:hypothetical protein